MSHVMPDSHSHLSPPFTAPATEGHAVSSAWRTLPLWAYPIPIHLSGLIINETSLWKPLLPSPFEQESPAKAH